MQSGSLTHHPAADEPPPIVPTDAPSLTASSERTPIGKLLSRPVALAVVLFAVAWLIYLTVGAIVIHRLALTGDEPWYVAQGYALIHDGTPSLTPIFHNQQFVNQFLQSVGSYSDHVRDYRGNGEFLLPNLPGYGFIVGVSYLLAGRWGIIALQAACSALTVLLLFFEARRLYGSRAAGLFAALAFLVALPAMLFTAQIFPTTIASSLTLVAFVLAGRLPAFLNARHHRLLGWLTGAYALAVVALPWLHFKYALVSAALVGILLLRLLPWLRGRRGAPARITRSAWAIAGTVTGAAIINFALIVVYCKRFFGTWLPQYSAANGGATDLAHPDIARFFSLFGDMFLSQQSGLVPWVPLTLLIIPGLVVLWRRSSAHAFDLLVCVVAQLAGFLSVLFTTAIYQGYALPSRFTVECAPFFALAATGAFAAGLPAFRQWWRRPRAQSRAEPLATPNAPDAARASDSPRRMPPRALLGVVLAGAALVVLLAGAWFSLVGLRTPEFLYGSTGGNRLVEKYTRWLPGWWFALFPDPEAIDPYIVSMPFSPASPAGVVDGVPMLSAHAEFLQAMPPGTYLSTVRFTCTTSAGAANATTPTTAAIVLTVAQIASGRPDTLTQTRIAPDSCAASQQVSATLRFVSDGYDPINFTVEYPAALTLVHLRVATAPLTAP